MQTITLPYGNGSQSANLPDHLAIQRIDAKEIRVDDSLETLLERAMNNPVGTARLEDIARADDSVVIVVNDHTRPGPNQLIMKAIVSRLEKAGIKDSRVTVLYATGSHRSPTEREMDDIVGAEYRRRFRQVAHDCQKDEDMTFIGETDTGMPVFVNRLATDCSLLVTTGLIAPIHTAGYSGGRKSVVPGIAGLKTLQVHHSFPIYQYEPAMGFVEGNPFHEIALAAAKKVGVKFIVNAVQEPNKKFIDFVAGDLEAAHAAGVKLCDAVSRVDIPKRADIVIASPGGFPRDIDLYQSQKALSVAEVIGKPDCTFIIVAECRDGFGEETFERWMIECASPREIIDRYAAEGFNVGNNKAFNFARALLKGRVVIVTDKLAKAQMNNAKLEWARDLQTAVDEALARGKPDTVSVMAQAANIVPRVVE